MKILVCIASYGMQNEPHLHRLLAEYRSMPHQVDIVVLSNLEKRLGPNVEVKVGLPAKNPWSLPFGHKQIFADRVNGYDLFIYSEDDHLITSDNIASFLKITSVLPENLIAGFMATESDKKGGLNFCGIHKHFHWDPFSIIAIDGYTFAHFTNEHTASYLLTKSQLQKAIHSGGFLVPPHEGKYDLPCTASTDPYTQCGFKKVVCISHIQEFMVKHLTNKYVGKEGIQNQDFDNQIKAMLRIGQGKMKPWELIKAETRLPASRWSKSYYEEPREDVLNLIPSKTRTVLSLGCGWGAAEARFVEKGFQVVALPLDPVISSSAELRGLKVLPGGFECAFKVLGARQFDCLFISNLLHLVDNPTSLLSSALRVTSKDGEIIVVVPNLTKLSIIWGRLKSDRRYKEMSTFEKTGVHTTSKRTVQTWFRNAGLKVGQFIEVQSPDEPIKNRLVRGLAGPLAASEFIVTGTRS